MTERKRINVITCAFNEEACIAELARRLFAVFDAHPQYEFDVLAIDNGSVDGTLHEMLEVQKRDTRFRVVQLSRNFGLQGGFAAGLDLADGDAAIIMAADLEDPPEVIPEFIAQWEQGFKNVFGIVTDRTGTPPLRRLNSRLFYWIIGKLSDHPLPSQARDFRLLDRKVFEEVRQLKDPSPFHRGLAAWTGFPSIGVEFVQSQRFAGTTKTPSRGIVEFAIRSIFTQSLTPIRFMPVFGFSLVVCSFLALVGIAVNSIVDGVPFPGFGTLLAVMVLMFGLLFCFISIIGIYIGLIFEHVRARPHYILDELWESGRPRSVRVRAAATRTEDSEHAERP
jgi:polyisoprenyl-phosphate glycosyltransferase